MPAQTINQSHSVIAVIERLIEEQEATFVNRMSMTEVHLRMSIVEHLKKYREGEMKFLDEFNAEGPTP